MNTYPTKRGLMVLLLAADQIRVIDSVKELIVEIIHGAPTTIVSLKPAFLESGVLGVEYDTTPCADKCNSNCVQAFQNTSRKKLLISAFQKDNSSC